MSLESKAQRLALKRRLTQPERDLISRARRARRRLGIMGDGDLSARDGDTGRGISLDCVDPGWHREQASRPAAPPTPSPAAPRR